MRPRSRAPFDLRIFLSLAEENQPARLFVFTPFLDWSLT